MIRATIIAVAAAVCSVTLFAQQVIRPKSDAPRFPFAGTDAEPASLQKIYSNLGTGTTVYSEYGYDLFGPSGGLGSFTQFIAMSFTPKSNSTVKAVSAAVQYESGTNQINLSIYNDAGGSPGTILAGPFTVTNVPNYFTCCKLATVAVLPSLSLVGGTQYWLVADIPPAGPGNDFSGVWQFVPVPQIPVSSNFGSSWIPEVAVFPEPAGAIYGTIP